MRSFLALLLVISLTGCAGVLIEPEDSRLTKAGKVAARVPFAVLTVGISETAFSCVRDTKPPLRWEGEVALGGTWLGPATKWAHLTPVAKWAHLTPDVRLGECIEELVSSDGDARPCQSLNQTGCGNAFQDTTTTRPEMSEDLAEELRGMGREVSSGAWWF